MKTGLLLEGGAMRGLFSAGVIDVLMENGIVFDGCMGVSAGAAFGGNYKSRQPGRAIRYNTTFARDPRYCSIASLVFTGDLYGAEFCYRTLPEELDIMDLEAYKDNPMEFYVVCTDADTGEAIYPRLDTMNRDDMDYVRASASMPAVSRAVEIEGHRYLDGGIADAIPVRKFQELGYDKIVAVLTQPADYIKKPQKGMPVLSALLKEYPGAAKKLQDRHTRYNETLRYIEQCEKEGSVYVIRPSHKLNIGRTEHDPVKMREVYGLGRIRAMSQLNEMKQFLAEESD